ncbi:MAG: hypothetical protein EP329_24545 [Deltaproteobacteria bacterium]|nr:MAG: hypothetical protein EP329_24545 [Deltaproteobacteria bacterium]
MWTTRIAALGLLTCLAPGAHAESTVDLIEHVFGASDVNGVSGNGGLTIGVGRRGDLTVLAWPSPSYTDHLALVSSNAPEVRDQPSMLGDPGMGAAIGLAWDAPAGFGFGWLRDAPWEATQAWGEPDAPVVATTFRNATLDLEVTVVDLVPPDRDVWVRRVTVHRGESSPVTAARVIFYANPAPTRSRVPQLPFGDWALDAYNDFAALYDADTEAVVHFRPAGHGDVHDLMEVLAPPAIDYGAVGAALETGALDEAAAAALVARLDDDYGPGAYLAVGADAPLVGHQVGFDATPLCDAADALVDNLQSLPDRFPGLTLPIDPALANVFRCDRSIADIRAAQGWTADAADAFADAADGVLSGDNGAAGRANEALAVAVDLDAAEPAVTFYTGVAATAAGARALLEGAREDGFAALREATIADWSAWIGRAHLPSTDDARVLEVCRRALMNIRVGTDRDTGAIVASVSRQAPYGLDWPRDGAFFDAALDAAGFPEMVEKHARFYLDTVRREPAEPDPLLNPETPVDPDDPDAATFPAWAWEMNYYADGLVGGNIRFEIDNTALTVWGLVDHARYLADEAARNAWLAEVWPVVRGATELLVRWRDPETGLHAPANEDDNVIFTQTLHGAATTWLAIDRAVAAAEALSHADEAARWGARADELKSAILDGLYDPESGLFDEGLSELQNPGNAAGGASSWMVWPARLLPYDDERVQRQMRVNLDLADARLDPKNGGAAYVTKILVAAALTLEDADARARVAAGLRAMVNHAATPDMGVFGETFVGVDSDGDGVNDTFSARVSNPHLWAGTLVYLTAMALYDPERITDPLGAEPKVEGGGGCTGGGPTAPPTLLALAAVAWLAARRRRSLRG